MKKRYSFGNVLVLILAVAILTTVKLASAGSGFDYSRGELMGNSGLTVFREADFGHQLGLAIYIDGVPITTLSWGEGYRAIVRPGRHVLSVTDTPAAHGKTRITKKTIDLAPGQNYAFTALWDVDTLLIEDGGYVFHGIYR